MVIKTGALFSEITGKLPVAGGQHKNAVSLLHSLFHRKTLGIGTDILRIFIIGLQRVGYFRVLVARNFDIVIALVVL